MLPLAPQDPMKQRKTGWTKFCNYRLVDVLFPVPIFFFFECYTPEKMHFSCMCVYRLLNEYGTCHYCVTVALKKLLVGLNAFVPDTLQLRTEVLILSEVIF